MSQIGSLPAGPHPVDVPIIPAEIADDDFYSVIERIAADPSVKTAIEIGSSSGDGSTAAFVAGMRRNLSSPSLYCVEASRNRFAVLRERYADLPFVHCYNASTASADQLPSEAEVASFYRSAKAMQIFQLSEVLHWLREGSDYIRSSGIDTDAIGAIKRDSGIDTFDMVLIDGSEFTGLHEYRCVDGAKYILMDDVLTYKCHAARKAALCDRRYDLIAEDLTLRNGYSVFRRRDRSPRITPGWVGVASCAIRVHLSHAVSSLKVIIRKTIRKIRRKGSSV